VGTMKPVAIVTDSCCDLPPEVVERFGITVVRLSFTIGHHTYRDGEIMSAEFYRLMKAAPDLPKTSQPPMGAFMDAYRGALESASELVSVHISSKLSGTIESAKEAARLIGSRVHVIDSLNLSGGQGLEVLAGAREAEAGSPLDAVVHAIESARERVSMIVGLDSLENLARGGRIGRVSAFFGGLLNLKVTLTVGPDGAFEPVARTRGTQAALQHTLDWVAAKMAGRTRVEFVVAHFEAPTSAEWLRSRLQQLYEVAGMHLVETGPVIATNCGTGWGVTVLPAE
jgi:DegV family protein with EDD domain